MSARIILSSKNILCILNYPSAELTGYSAVQTFLLPGRIFNTMKYYIIICLINLLDCQARRSTDLTLVKQFTIQKKISQSKEHITASHGRIKGSSSTITLKILWLLAWSDKG